MNESEKEDLAEVMCERNNYMFKAKNLTAENERLHGELEALRADMKAESFANQERRAEDAKSQNAINQNATIKALLWDLVEIVNDCFPREAPPPSITMNGYQKATDETVVYDPYVAVEYCTLQIGGEAGEVLSARAKHLRKDFGYEEYKRRTVHECGGLIWHVARLLAELGVSLGDCATKNLEELKSRFERGVVRGDGAR